MTEVTHEDWMNNPMPRMMYVWDGDESTKHTEKVVYIASKEDRKESRGAGLYPVYCLVTNHKHCAEIEEEETRLNNYEMGQLLKCFGVEWKCKCNAFTETSWSYTSEEDREIPDLEELKIRYKQGEWEEPTRETVLKWGEESVNQSGFADIERFISFIGWDKE